MTHPALEQAVDAIIERVGRRIVCGIPLGLGKPNALVNALYRRAKGDSSINLQIFTALSLDVPQGGSDLERRFLKPFTDRQFGADYPRLDYVIDMRAGRVPDNIRISEFYFLSGAWLDNPQAQQNYISTNYTFVSREMADMGVNLLLQWVAKKDNERGLRYSLSCNPDVTLDLLGELKKRGQSAMTVAQVSDALPFMYGRADVADDFFDIVVDEPSLYHRPFGVPRQPVETAEYAIGLLASTLVKDAGTLQIGIGALGDALVYGLLMRQRDNAGYRQLAQDLDPGSINTAVIERIGDLDPFETGLYGASEMFTEGFMHLYRGGLLKRRVYDDVPLQRLLNDGAVSETITTETLRALVFHRELPRQIEPQHVLWLEYFGIFNPGVEVQDGHLLLPDGRRVANNLDDQDTLDALRDTVLGDRMKHGVLIHAAFLLGSSEFYQRLREMPPEKRRAFRMTNVGNINQLYGGREELDRLQRVNARFINTAMMMTLTGAAVSDALEDNRLVSGVGGQYNFVAMAHALDDGRSILMLRSTRSSGGKVHSNIRWNYGHVTIPRHLRDIVITEYGIADLRGCSDAQCIKAMLNITDSRFQQQLRRQAVRAGKLDRRYRIPKACRNNLPKRLEQAFDPHRGKGEFPRFPFGCDLTEQELALAGALKRLKKNLGSWSGRGRLLLALLRKRPETPEQTELLKRMKLAEVSSLKEKFYRALLRSTLP